MLTYHTAQSTRAGDDPPFPLPSQPCSFSIVLDDTEACFYGGLTVTQAVATQLEIDTRGQSHSKTWHKVRTNRLTSSSFKRICSRVADFKVLADNLKKKTKSADKGDEARPGAGACCFGRLSRPHRFWDLPKDDWPQCLTGPPRDQDPTKTVWAIASTCAATLMVLASRPHMSIIFKWWGRWASQGWSDVTFLWNAKMTITWSGCTLNQRSGRKWNVNWTHSFSPFFLPALCYKNM